MLNGDTGEDTKFSQILQRTVDVATGLQKLGVRRGDTVALCSENRLEYLYGAIGAICAGATITTINLMYSKDELLHALSISRPRIVFASQVALKMHLVSLKSFSSIETIIQLDGTTPIDDIRLFNSVAVGEDNVRGFEPVEVQGHSDTAFIFYSSGTTGLPKGVALTHSNYLYSVALFEAQDRESTRLISVLPWYHAYGLMSTINYLLVKNFLVYFSGGFNPQKYLQCIQTHKIRVLVTVPPIVLFLAKAPAVAQFDLSSVELVWCGAAPLSAEVIDAALKRLPKCKGIFQAYGMTETSLAATSDKPEDNLATKIGSGGYPIPGVKIKVVQIVTRAKLGPNQEGEVCVKGPIVMKGYVGEDSASRDIIDEEGYLMTGDIGYYDADGCLFIVDRLKELIKYKGYQVAPATVENAVLSHSGVAECGVVGAPDERAGEVPVAFVVLKPGVKLTEKDILHFTEDKLSVTSRLHSVRIVSEIPKNASGKILRRLLKEKFNDKN